MSVYYVYLKLLLYFCKRIHYNCIYQQALKYSHELGYIILALAVVIVAFLAYKGLKKK